MPNRVAIIRQRVWIPAKPVEVYDAFLNASKHSAFTGAKATGTGKVGSRFTAWDGYISGRVLALQPARRIVQEWKTTEWPAAAPPSRLEFRFRPKRNGTEVTMIQSNVPAAQAPNYRRGWKDYYWTPLTAYFRRTSAKGATGRARRRKSAKM